MQALPADANDLASRLDHLAPPYPPPPAVIRKHAHGDCRTSYAPRRDRDPNPMCKVKGGTFMMGGGATLDRADEQESCRLRR